MQLTEFDWMLINELLYKTFKAENHRQLRVDCLEHLHLLIRFDKACFYLSAPDSSELLADGIGDNFSAEAMAQYTNLYLQKEYSSWLRLCTESRIYRITDYLTPERWMKHPFFQQLTEAHNIRYLVRLPLLHNEKLVGLLSLFRLQEHGDFSDQDLFILDSIKKHLSLGLWQRIYGLGDSPSQLQKLEKLAEQYCLTLREQEVLALLAAGEQNEYIANALYIALNTEKKHLRNIYNKMNISGRNDLLKLLQK